MKTWIFYLASCVDTNNNSFIIDGKYLKSLNRHYNKRKAYFQSLLPEGVYTSKSSVYDNDPIKKDMYSGKRIKRGLYQTKDKRIVNADINAALNIYKKYIMKSNSTDNNINYLMSRGLTIPSRVIVAL
jgi:transposase